MSVELCSGVASSLGLEQSAVIASRRFQHLRYLGDLFLRQIIQEGRFTCLSDWWQSLTRFLPRKLRLQI